MENKNKKKTESKTKTPKTLNNEKRNHALKHRPLNHLRKSLESDKCLSRL